MHWDSTKKYRRMLGGQGEHASWDIRLKSTEMSTRAKMFEGIYICNRNDHASWDIRHKSSEMSTRAGLLSQIDAWQCSGSSEMYPALDPKMEEINRLFAQIDI